MKGDKKAGGHNDKQKGKQEGRQDRRQREAEGTRQAQ